MSCGTITAFKVKVTAKVQNVSEYLSGWYHLNRRTFCYETWYGDAASLARVSCGKKLVCYLQGQGHSKDSCDQNMALSTISSKLFISWQLNLVWWYIITSQSVLWRKKRVTAFKVKVTVKGKMSVFVQMISSKLPNILLPNLVLWFITVSRSACEKIVCYFQGQGHSKSSNDQNIKWSKSSDQCYVHTIQILVSTISVCVCVS